MALALALGYLSAPPWFAFESSPSPGLASLAAFVTILAAIDVLSAAFWTMNGGGAFLARWLNSPKAQSALRILYVLGCAAAIVWLAREVA